MEKPKFCLCLWRRGWNNESPESKKSPVKGVSSGWHIPVLMSNVSAPFPKCRSKWCKWKLYDMIWSSWFMVWFWNIRLYSKNNHSSDSNFKLQLNRSNRLDVQSSFDYYSCIIPYCVSLILCAIISHVFDYLLQTQPVWAVKFSRGGTRVNRSRGQRNLGVQGAEPLGGGQGACLLSAKIVIEALPEHVFPY